MRTNENILISSLTTMRLGGAARYVIEVESPSEVADAYGFAEEYNLPAFALGYGANTIGHDEGYPGVIIISRMMGIEQLDPTHIKVMSGEYWDDVVAYACERGLTGIEALSKIPGLAGAAPVQNIGAYGQEISDTLVEIEVYDIQNHTYQVLSKADLKFGYRQSILNTTAQGRYFVISITLELRPGEMPRPFYKSITQYMVDNNITDTSPLSIRNIVSAIRADKLPDPLVQASAGSFFKNVQLTEDEARRAEVKGYPVYNSNGIFKINSAWLIEHAGYKGALVHGFRVNEKAPLVLINESATGYQDLKAARSEIASKVYDKFGYWLEQEPVELV